MVPIVFTLSPFIPFTSPWNHKKYSEGDLPCQIAEGTPGLRRMCLFGLCLAVLCTIMGGNMSDCAFFGAEGITICPVRAHSGEQEGIR